jgi:glycosyltransferase involved in cell wall biosynthesis
MPSAPNLEWHVATAETPVHRLWWDQVTLRRLLRQHQADALFSFANYGQLFCSVPQLLSVQSSIYFSALYRQHILPHKPLSFRITFALRRWWVRHSVRAADCVLAPTASLLADLRRAVPLREGRIAVNPFGVAATALDPPARSYDGRIDLLLPTLYTDYKNLGTALRALRLLRERHGNRFRLLTTADPQQESSRTSVTWKEDVELLDELVQTGAVDVVGPLPHKELLQLYARCHVLVYPTLTESFGFPLVEALAAGLPVVASDIPVNRELARDAALYFDPLNPEQLAARIEEILSREACREELIRRGREQARTFCWAAHVRRLLDSLDKLAAHD